MEVILTWDCRFLRSTWFWRCGEDSEAGRGNLVGGLLHDLWAGGGVCYSFMLIIAVLFTGYRVLTVCIFWLFHVL